MSGQGEPGRRGGSPGDLLVAIRVKPHPVFTREGQVIACELPVTDEERVAFERWWEGGDQ